MLKNKYFLLSIITLSLIFNVFYSLKADISVDAMMFKFISSNRTHYPHHESFIFSGDKKIYPINDFLDLAKIKTKRDFFKEVSYYYKNFGKTDDHGPVFSTLARLPIIRSLDLWGFRLIGFIFFILSLFAFNALMKELVFAKEARYLALMLINVSLLSQEMIFHGRMYAVALFLNIFTSYIFIKALKSKSFLALSCYLIALFVSIHLCFLNYFFYSVYLIIIFLGLITYMFINNDEFNIPNKHFLLVSSISALSLSSLFVYLDFIKPSIEHGLNGWPSRSIKPDFISKLLEMLDKLIHIFNPEFTKPYCYILFLISIICIFYFSKLKKSIAFLIIVFGIPLSMIAIDLYFDTNTTKAARYLLAAFPAIIMLYGLSFYKKPKIFLSAYGLILLSGYIFPKLKDQQITYHGGPEYSSIIKVVNQINPESYDSRKTILITNLRHVNRFLFAKYFVEKIDSKSALFEQKTKQEIYVTLPNINSKSLFEFIKNKKLDSVIIVNNSVYSKQKFEKYEKLYLKVKNLLPDVNVEKFIVPSN